MCTAHNIIRNTPLGAMHRGLWIHLPSGFRRVDQRVTNGQVSAWVGRTAHHLWNDRHPVIMVRVDLPFWSNCPEPVEYSELYLHQVMQVPRTPRKSEDGMTKTSPLV